jgi:hypothetical protein
MDTNRGVAMNTAVRLAPTCRRRARARRRWVLVLLVTVFTIALGTGVDAPRSQAHAALVAGGG